MKKSLIIAISIGALFAVKTTPVIAGGGMDMAGTFAMRFDQAKELLKLSGILSYASDGQLILIDDQGQKHRITNPNSVENLIKSGVMQVALEAVEKDDNEIKVIRIHAL